MLGPSIIVAGVPLSVGYSSHTVRRLPHVKSARLAKVLSIIEAALLMAILLMILALT